MECAHCRGEIALAPKQLGQTWTCPHCRRAFHAPGPSASKPRAATGLSRRVGRCPSCFHKYFRPDDPAEDKCPACGYETAAPALPVGAAAANAGGMTGHDYSAGRYAPTPDNEIAEMYLKLAELQRYLLRNGIGNLIAGSLWTLTIVGAIVGIPLIGLGIFELVQYSRRTTMSPYAFAKTMSRLAIVKIVISLPSVVGLYWAFLIRSRAKEILAICERHGIAA